MPISLGFWEWGCPKCGDVHITVSMPCLCMIGGLKCSNLEYWSWAESTADVPDRTNLNKFVRNNHRSLQKCGMCQDRLSQTNGDIYDFEFSLVGKIWDVRETKKSLIVWDFSDIGKPGFKDSTHLIPEEKF